MKSKEYVTTEIQSESTSVSTSKEKKVSESEVEVTSGPSEKALGKMRKVYSSAEEQELDELRRQRMLDQGTVFEEEEEEEVELEEGDYETEPTDSEADAQLVREQLENAFLRGMSPQE